MQTSLRPRETEKKERTKLAANVLLFQPCRDVRVQYSHVQMFFETFHVVRLRPTGGFGHLTHVTRPDHFLVRLISSIINSSYDEVCRE